MKLKEKLKNWLFKEELDEIKNRLEITEKETQEIKESYDYCLKTLRQCYDKMAETIGAHDKSRDLLEDCRKFMNSVCDIGTDVGFKYSDHSWAVICVHGKMDYVKFVDMNQSDIREIASFLKRFEYSNRVTDGPLYNRVIEDMIIHL